MHLRIACAGFALFGAVSAVSAQTSDSRSKVPPAPILFRWPDPTFLPKRQCTKPRFEPQQLEAFAARTALVERWLPGTREVALAPETGCIVVVTSSVSNGRMAELALRGVAVPRRAVLMRAEGP